VLGQQMCSDTAAPLPANMPVGRQGVIPLPASGETADFSKHITKPSHTIEVGVRCYLFLKEMFIFT